MTVGKLASYSKKLKPSSKGLKTFHVIKSLHFFKNRKCYRL